MTQVFLNNQLASVDN